MSYKRVKVWNDDDKEYVEMYQEREVRIPPRGYIIMQRHEAADFLGKWVNPIDRSGQEKNFKRLRKEPIVDERQEILGLPKTFCPVCKQDMNTMLALGKHIRKNHPELIPVEAKDDTGGTGDVSQKQV